MPVPALTGPVLAVALRVVALCLLAAVAASRSSVATGFRDVPLFVGGHAGGVLDFGVLRLRVVADSASAPERYRGVDTPVDFFRQRLSLYSDAVVCEGAARVWTAMKACLLAALLCNAASAVAAAAGVAFTAAADLPAAAACALALDALACAAALAVCALSVAAWRVDACGDRRVGNRVHEFPALADDVGDEGGGGGGDASVGFAGVFSLLAAVLLGCGACAGVWLRRTRTGEGRSGANGVGGVGGEGYPKEAPPQYASPVGRGHSEEMTTLVVPLTTPRQFTA